MQIRYGLAGMAMLCATGAAAQNFTTAAEVRPILEATKPNWIAVRNYEGQDWLYFTQILSWRCGLSDVWFSVNGAPEERLDMEACHEDTNVPAHLSAGIGGQRGDPAGAGRRNRDPRRV